MAVPIVNPSPAQRYRSNPTWVNQHRELIVSDPFMRAVDYGLLEYASLLAKQNENGNSAMAGGFKLQGAMELVQTLRHLSEFPRTVAPITPDQLDHRI
jgi:hypothetical protein